MTEPVELRTERLLRRPYKLDDVEDVFTYASDPEWARYLPDPQPFAQEQAEEFVPQRVLAPWDTNPGWALVLRGRVIGHIGLRISQQNETGELAYSVAREHWGQGSMPEAARAVVQWGFKELGVSRGSSRELRRVTRTRSV